VGIVCRLSTYLGVGQESLELSKVVALAGTLGERGTSQIRHDLVAPADIAVVV
jgi:hypothetical protein